jgi:hypothetical protein
MPERRIIRDGDEYTVDEDERGEIEREEVPRRPEPPVEVQGEPWEWTKPGPRPKGWPGPDNDPRWRNRDDPGPYDGEWR